MKLARAAVVSVSLLLWLAPRAAEALTSQLTLGADYWFERAKLVNLTLDFTSRVSAPLSVGGRLGAAMVVDDPVAFVVPNDIILRIHMARAWLDLLGGVWAFTAGDPLRVHGGLGLGLRMRGMTIAVEGSFLQPNVLVGVRIGILL